jgi:hypothetical protein
MFLSICFHGHRRVNDSVAVSDPVGSRIPQANLYDLEPVSLLQHAQGINLFSVTLFQAIFSNCMMKNKVATVDRFLPFGKGGQPQGVTSAHPEKGSMSFILMRPKSSECCKQIRFM